MCRLPGNWNAAIALELGERQMNILSMLTGDIKTYYFHVPCILPRT